MPLFDWCINPWNKHVADGFCRRLLREGWFWGQAETLMVDEACLYFRYDDLLILSHTNSLIQAGMQIHTGAWEATLKPGQSQANGCQCSVRHQMGESTMLFVLADGNELKIQDTPTTVQIFNSRVTLSVTNTTVVSWANTSLLKPSAFTRQSTCTKYFHIHQWAPALGSQCLQCVLKLAYRQAVINSR